MSTKGIVMKNALQSNLIQTRGITAAGGVMLLGLMLVAGTATSIHA